MGLVKVTDRRDSLRELADAIHALAQSDHALFEALERFIRLMHYEQLGSFLRKRKEAS